MFLLSKFLNFIQQRTLDYALAKEFLIISKTALNAFTIHLANELKDTNIKVNSGHQLWVKTELGGPNAPIEVEDSYKTSLRLATLDNDGPSGVISRRRNITLVNCRIFYKILQMEFSGTKDYISTSDLTVAVTHRLL